MPSTFTDELGLEKQATGENSGTWGTLLNALFDMLDDAIAARLALSVAGASDVTLSTAQALHIYHEYTGALTGSISVIVPASDSVYHIFNNTSGAFTLTVKTSAGTGVIVPQGSKTILYADSTNVVGVDTFPNLKQMKGADVASASDLLVNIDGTIFDVTGTTTIDTIASKGIGTVIKLHFDGALTLTHHATNLILPSVANITTAAGDEAEFYEYASADWRCTSYTKATGTSVKGVALNADGGVTFEDTDDSAAVGPIVDLYRNSASPAVDDDLGAFQFTGESSTGVKRTYAEILTDIVDPTNASEDSGLRFQTIRGGALADRMELRGGLFSPGAAGTDKGTESINFQTVWANGVQVLPLALDTMVDATNSGADDLTEVDFTGIASTAKRITITFQDVSLSGTDNILVQLGDAGGFETTVYVSAGSKIAGGTVTSTSATTGFIVKLTGVGIIVSGTMVLNLMDAATFLWIGTHTFGETASNGSHFGGGSKALSDTLTQVRITRSGTNTFDGGNINIVVE